MITKKDYGFELTHRFGGNGWAFLEDLGDQYVKLIAVGKDGVGSWTPVAWTKLLSRTNRPLSKTILDLIDERRQQLKK